METRLTETVPPSMYFNNNDYIDDGGTGDDPEKELEPGFGDEELDGGASPGVGGNDDDDDKGGMME